MRRRPVMIFSLFGPYLSLSRNVPCGPSLRRSKSLMKPSSLRICATANFVRDALGAANVHLDHVSDGRVALKTLEGSTNYEVLIVDNGLPGLSGLELQRRLRDKQYAIPVIIITGGDEWRATALDQGAVAVLCKPLNPEDLLAAIRSALEHAGDSRR